MNGDKYGHWKKAMEVALIAKNKLGFVLTFVTKSTITSALYLLNGIDVIKW